MATIITTEKNFQVTEKINMQPILAYENKKMNNNLGWALRWLGVICAIGGGLFIADACVFIGGAIFVVGVIQSIAWNKNPNNRIRNPKDYDAAVLDFVARYKNTPEGQVKFSAGSGENVIQAELFGYLPLERELGYGYNSGRYYSRRCVYTRMAVCEDKLVIYMDEFISDFVNDRGIHRDYFEIPYSEIAGLAATSYNVKSYDCSLEAVVVSVLRIQSQQGGVLDCPFSPSDDVETLLSVVNERMRG